MCPKDTHEVFPRAVDLTGVYGVFSKNPTDPAYYFSGDPDAFYKEAPRALREDREAMISGQASIEEIRLKYGVK